MFRQPLKNALFSLFIPIFVHELPRSRYFNNNNNNNSSFILTAADNPQLIYNTLPHRTAQIQSNTKKIK